MTQIDPFLEQYRNLNDAQRQAVDTMEGPVMVIAGPGTGKTSILTLRIANILRKTDTPPSGILALTFTESGVHSMRRKLVNYIGVQAYRVHIYTFHGFAQEIIGRYPEYFPRIIGGAVASDSERFSLLEEDLTTGEYDLIRPYGKPTLYVRKAIGAIADLKRDGVDPTAFSHLLDTQEKEILGNSDLYHEKGRSKGSMKREYADGLRSIKKNRELTLLFAAYEEALRSKSLYDYDDMLGELVRALKTNADLLRTLQEEYLYILADEHQDANNSQNAVLELLSDYRDTRNLFIVGDEKQAIYRFQGASLENFLYFQKKYPDAVVIFLDTNYRSTQTILDASHALMTGGGATVPLKRPRLLAAGKEKAQARISMTRFETADDELEGIARSIKESTTAGVPGEEHAVLVRTNSQIAPVGRALAGFGVPFMAYTDDDVLADSDISKLMRLLRAAVSPESDELIGSMLFIDFLGVHPVDAVRLNRAAREQRCSPLEVLSRKDIQPKLTDAPAVDSLARNFTRWMLSATNDSALDAFLSIIEDTKFQQYLLTKRESLEKIEKLTKLYDEIKVFLAAHKDATLKDFIASIDTLIRHGSPLSFSRRSLGASGVHVMTAHKAKGLEWQQVYIPSVADKVWGNRRVMGGFELPPPLGGGEDSERSEDERRLFYVALTRAKKAVKMSYSRLDGRGKDRLLSQFVSELPDEFIEYAEGDSTPGGERLSRASKRHTTKERTVWDRDYLRKLFLEQGLNATALNNYLDCPWKYFFKNLVRLPDTQGSYLHFGNAVHAALKSFADARREGKSFSKMDAVKVFEQDIIRRPLSKAEYRTTLAKGKKIIPLYIAARASLWHDNALTEYDIKGVSVLLSDGVQLLLRGRIDKVELLEGGAVNVVDYKTGDRKTRNEVLGETKNSNGDIKRQLDFYRLLLDLHDNGKYEMVSADVDFVEPDSKNVIKPPEHFEMKREDGERVKTEAMRVAQEILLCEFSGHGCGEEKCEYCELSKLIEE